MKALALNAKWDPETRVPSVGLGAGNGQGNQRLHGLASSDVGGQGDGDSQRRAGPGAHQGQGLWCLRIGHALLRDRRGRLHPLSGPDQVPHVSWATSSRARSSRSGSAVDDLQVGDMVTAEEMIWCGHCRPCRDGFPNHCTNLEEIGFTIQVRLPSTLPSAPSTAGS